MWEDNRGWTFSLVKVLLWTGILARSDRFKLKRLDGFVYYKHSAFHFTDIVMLLFIYLKIQTTVKIALSTLEIL